MYIIFSEYSFNTIICELADSEIWLDDKKLTIRNKSIYVSVNSNERCETINKDLFTATLTPDCRK